MRRLGQTAAATLDQQLVTVRNMQLARRRCVQLACLEFAIRPRTDSGAHVYFGRVTAMQTAADHVGVARCAAVRAGQADSRGRPPTVGGLPWNGHCRRASRPQPLTLPHRRHVGVDARCRIRDSRRYGGCSTGTATRPRSRWDPACPTRPSECVKCDHCHAVHPQRPTRPSASLANSGREVSVLATGTVNPVPAVR
jgi:hypothetical protein